jgi:serine/threonine protein kinase
MNSDSTSKTDETYDGITFFRKYGPPLSKNHAYSNKVERTIIKILMENPHPNIVTYYDITDDHITMEQLCTEKSASCYIGLHPMSYDDLIEIQELMENVKTYLQGLGIMYVDWKFDNMGKSIQGKYKLFDFDASGLSDLKTQEWKLKANPIYWSYKEAIKNGAQTPKEIDDWSFNYNIIEEGEKLINA